MIKINRRDFLKGSVALGVAGAISGTVLNTLKPSKAHADETGTIGYTPTTCVGCTTWCPVEAKTQLISGIKRAIDVRGHQDSNRGSDTGATTNDACPRARIALQEAYDADRVKVAMRRTNPVKGKGEDPGFIPISMESAMAEIADKMYQLRQANNSHRYVYLRGRYTYGRMLNYEGINKIYGSPNGISHSAICAEAENASRCMAIGKWGYSDYDLDACKYLMLWGVDPVSSNRMVSGAIHKLGRRMNGKLENGDPDPAGVMTVVSIDPRLNVTGAKADRWLAPKPGTDGALALAMAAWILNQGLYNEAFVVTKTGTSFAWSTDGIADGVATLGGTELGTKGVAQWWAKVLSKCSPDATNFNGTGKSIYDITGIDAATIKEVAAEFAAAGEQAISWIGPGVSMQPNGSYAGWVVVALNGLVGSIDTKGGIIQEEPSNSFYSADNPNNANYALYQDAKATAGAGKQKITKMNSTYGKYEAGMPALGESGALSTAGGTTPTNRTADSIRLSRTLGAYPYETKLIVAAMANFPFSCTGAERWEEALNDDGTLEWSASTDNGKAPFVVSITTHVSELAMYSDIVLPGKHVGLEAKGSTHQRSGKYKGHSIYSDVIPAVWPDAINAENEYPWLLGQALFAIQGENEGKNLLDYMRTEYPSKYDGSGPIARDTSSSDFEDLHWRYHATRKTTHTTDWDAIKPGTTHTTTYDLGSGKYITAGNGLTQATYKSTYFVGGRGEWWRDAVLATPTGKFLTQSKKLEFYNPNSFLYQGLTNYISKATVHGTSTLIYTGTEVEKFAAVLTDCNYKAIADQVTVNSDISYALMPNWDGSYLNDASKSGDPATHPFTFIDHKSRLNREGRSANAPLYHEFKSCDPGDEKWSDVVKINPADAAKIKNTLGVVVGVKDGDTVKVTNKDGHSITCKVKVWSGVREKTVAKAYGQGHWAYGRYASKTFGSEASGGNNNSVVHAEFERICGATARNGVTRVKIEKV